MKKIKFNNNDFEIAKEKIEHIIKEQGYILFDDTEEEVWKHCYDKYNSVNNFENSNYGNDKVYFYDKKYNFFSVEELEKFFNIKEG